MMISMLSRIFYIPDVKFRDEEGILHGVQVDRSQKMKVNEEKLKKYEEFTQIYKQKYNGKMPVMNFFTVTKYSGENWKS